VLNADYRELAAKTYWDINKNTIARYCESSMWTTKLNGVPIADAIYETIRCSLTHSPQYLTHSLTHALTHLNTLLTHSLTHSGGVFAMKSL
jgi:hypothetical protein